MTTLLTAGHVNRRQALDAIERLPQLSPMVTHLLTRLAHRNCEILELVTVVEKDALLSAQMLRLANSAAFARKAGTSCYRFTPAASTTFAHLSISDLT